MKCHYEILGVSSDSSSEELKKAYRKLALEWHPDKNLDRLNEATETFQLIQQAYEILIDPQERAWYDRHKEDILRGDADEAYKDDCLNVYQYFNASCYKGFNDDEKGFYTVFRHVFETIANEDKPFLDKDDEDIEIPHFGYSSSSYEEVVHNFYAYWQSYCTSKSFSWVDKFDLFEARKTGAGRQVIRMMEKENKKLRDQQKKARNEEVRELVAFVRKRDKRVQAHKKKEDERKIEKAKRAEEIRKQQVLERNKYFENSKESELLSMEKEKFEKKFDELENSVDAAFGTNTTESDEEAEDALYCVACEKDFRSEKAMRNHENSKKHKENLVLLKYLMKEEDRALQDDSEGEDQSNEEHENSPLEENKETSEALLEELIKSSSKSKKKKKKGKPVLAEPPVSVENESDSELCSKIDEVKVDCCPEESTKPIETKPLPKNNSIKKKVKKGKTTNEKVPSDDCPSDKEEEEEKPTTYCETCKVDYKSRNKLFAHLKESGHAVYKNENTKQGTSASTKRKKKKKC